MAAGSRRQRDATTPAISHITSLTIADAADLQASHTLGAMTAILLTVALSSPKATDRTNR